jgi:hypothetical protein
LTGPTNCAGYRNKILYFILKREVLYRITYRQGSPVYLLVIPQSLKNTLLEAAHDASGH